MRPQDNPPYGRNTKGMPQEHGIGRIMVQYGLLECKDCTHVWPDELPPLWLAFFPDCPECGGNSKLRTKLHDVVVLKPKRKHRWRNMGLRVFGGTAAVAASNASVTRHATHLLHVVRLLH